MSKRKSKKDDYYQLLYRTFPILFWKKCDSCKFEFIREWGWKAITDPYVNNFGEVKTDDTYLCTECASTKEEASDYFKCKFNEGTKGDPPPRPKKNKLIKTWY